jgi:hypothetical protein
LEAGLEKTKQANIEILAVFTALFTFVSIEFQLIRKFDYLQFLYFSIFFGGLLVGFTFILSFIIQKELTLKFIFIMALVVMGIYFGFVNLKEVKITKSPLENIDINKINIEKTKVDP